MDFTGLTWATDMEFDTKFAYLYLSFPFVELLREQSRNVCVYQWTFLHEYFQIFFYGLFAEQLTDSLFKNSKKSCFFHEILF